MLSNPVTVAVTPSATTVELIDQHAIRVDKAGKPGALAGILASEAVDRALVFTRTKHGADRVVRALVQAGIPAEAIHGNKTQGNRERTMAAFRSGNIRTLVATDIAARGIDVDGISHVINYDLPNIPETYVHRIGRTARAGATGIAISLISADEMPFLRAIEKLIRRTVPLAGGANRDSITEKAEATREHRRGDNRGRGNRRPERNDDRPARHADGGQPNRGKHRGGGKGRPQGEQRHGNGNAGNGNGGNRHRDGGNRQPDNRPSKGSNGGIAEVGFMGRPRRSGGMSQGPA
jgi:ATP-dependent RNA helicase RhlE